MHRTPLSLVILLLAVALAACQVPAISSTPAMTTGAVTPIATPAAATPAPAAATLALKSAATPVAVETPTGLPTPSPLEVKRADLVLATRASGQDFEFVQKLVREFTASTGWTVEVVPKEGDVLRLDFETTVLAGQGYDLVWTVGDDVGPLVAADLLRPVADFFKAADYVPAAVTAASLNGSQWGVPLSASNHLLLFYNKKLIPGPPRTTDELLSLPKPAGADVLLVADQTDPLWLVPWLGGFGGTLFGADNRPSLNTPEMVNTLKFLKQLRDKGVVAQAADFAVGDALFKAGKAAMIINGDWAIGTYTGAGAPASQNLDLGIAPLPTVSATNRPAAPFVVGTYLLVPRALPDQKLEAAKAFITYVTSSEVQARFATELGRLPALVSALKSDTVQGNPLLKPVADALEHGVGIPPRIDMRAIWNAIGPEIGAVLAGDKEPETAAQDMQAAAESAITRSQ